MYDWFERNGYGDEIIEPTDVRFVCEQNSVIFRPFQNYYFEVDWTCDKCVKIANEYGMTKENSP